MAGDAVGRRRLVKQHVGSTHRFYVVVAAFTADVLVHAFEREAGASFVIEERRFPLVAVVARIALGHDAGGGKLPGVDVLVATIAGGWGRSKAHVDERGLQVRRAMTIGASDRAVAAKQLEARGSMIEARQVLP